VCQHARHVDEHHRPDARRGVTLVPLPTAQGAAADFLWSSAVLLTGPRGWYLVRRNPALAFFPDYWALPGGQLDVPIDGPPPPDAVWHTSLANCALRELFEEVGVAPAPLAAELARVDGGREALRAALLGEGASERAAAHAFARSLAAASGARAALDPLTFATTPRFALRRFRTFFFECVCPSDEQPTVVHGELVEGAWFEPRELLARWRRGGLSIVPPVVALLEALERHGDWPRARAAAAAHSFAVDRGALHVVSPAPGIAMAPLRTRTIPPATTTNCYVLGNERAFVIDPASDDEGTDTAALIAYLETRRAALAGVVVTHHHPDHVGAVAEVAEHFALPVFAHPRTLERLPSAPQDARPLADGDVLDLGRTPSGSASWHATVHHTPGHADGHVCLVESNARALIAGDLVSTLSTIVIDPPEGHLATYLASLTRMAALELGPLLPSHGPAAAHGRRLIEAYLRHRAQREARLVAALARGPRHTEAELLAVVYDDTPPALSGLAARSLLAGLLKLAEEGRARRVGAAWAAAGEAV
jgi:glyoxylase-like metal-dependent hydrolase (beta-lactamase superfamily II)/8-oxo-dGTP pyrophosphatase MutT (NUDIX family)